MADRAECLQHRRGQITERVLAPELAILAALHNLQAIRRIHSVLLAASPKGYLRLCAASAQTPDPGADPHQLAGLDSSQQFKRNRALALFPEARDSQQLPASFQITMSLPTNAARKQIEWIRSRFAPTLRTA